MLKNIFASIVRNKIKIAVSAVAIGILVASLCLTGQPRESVDLPVNAKSGKRVYNFLLLGVDRSEKLSDVIILASLDTEEGSATVVQIPRDTYAEYTSAAYRKMNGAVSSLGGGGEVADFLEGVLHITVDYYVTLDLDALSQAVDLLGGVEVDVPADMEYEDKAQGLSIKLNAGRQLLDGEKAMQFVRYRCGYVRGDIARLDAQKIFLSALCERLASGSLAELLTVAQTLITNSESNVSVADCIKIVSKATKLKADSIRLVTAPGADIQSSGGAWYYVLNKKETYSILDRYFDCRAEYSEFDSNRLLTGAYSKEFNEIYDAQSGYECKIYTAAEINSENIEIEKIK